jgi:hypothetical protein
VISSQNGAQIAPSVHIGKNIWLNGTLNTWSGGPRVGGTILQNATGIPDPPSYELPRITYNPTDWTAKGFASTLWTGACDSDNRTNSYPDHINAYLGSLTNPTLVWASACGFKWSNSNTISLKTDVALFADSFTISNTFRVKSADGQPHKLWLIVPAAATGNACSGDAGNIQTSNSTTFMPLINIFLYSPCTVTISNNSESYGQIYGGTVTIANAFSMTFTPVPIPGVELPGGPPVSSGEFSIDIIYKREARNAPTAS